MYSSLVTYSLVQLVANPATIADNIKVFNAPATKTANDEIGLKIVANIVMVGVITKITGVISENAAIEAIKDSVPAGTEEKNVNAFNVGYNLV